jgi:hypothetical protein
VRVKGERKAGGGGGTKSENGERKEDIEKTDRIGRE